jgi:plastocyanin
MRSRWLSWPLRCCPRARGGVADVIKNSGNSFDQSTYYSDQGDLVQYEHTGGAPHNVTSTESSGGEPLFSSDTISSGTTPVDGTQDLAPGTYPFICTVHPTQMKADLVVREAPPDETTPPPDVTTPPPDVTTPPPDVTTPPVTEPLTLDLEAKKQELRKKLKFFATATVASTLVARGEKIKETAKQLAANQKTKVKAKLKQAARKRLEEKLEKAGRAKVKIKGTATAQSGAEATDTVTVKLKG